jgi:F-type H+-transporting ATPase subunit epsilon
MSKGVIELQIVTPHGVKYEGKVTGVQLFTRLGQIEVLPEHEPMIIALDIGEAKVSTLLGESLYFATNKGYIEVLEDRVEVVSETAELSKNVDIERANHSLERAQEELKGLDSTEDRERIAQVLNKIRRAETRIAVSKLH